MKKRAEKKRFLASFLKENTAFLIVGKHNVTFMQASKLPYIIDNQDYTSPSIQNECDNVTM